MKQPKYPSGSTRDLIHELSGPLTAAQLAVDLIDKAVAAASGELPSGLREELSQHLGTAKAACTQVQAVLDSARWRADTGASDDFEDVDLRAIVCRAKEILEPRLAGRVCLAARFEETPVVRGSRVELTQLLLNLLGNALDAVDADPVGSSRVGVWTHTDRLGKAVLEISDNGAGIPPGLRDQIFDPSVSTKSRARHRGLGLSICKRVVERHAGDIELVKTGEQGTCFRVTLPPATHLFGQQDET